MHPDAYMPVYWTDFWQAVEGWEDHQIVGYERLLSYYWHHNHCAGLENNKAKLQRISRIKDDLWDEAFSLIFGTEEFFVLGNGNLWHQKRALEEWSKSTKKYAERVERAKNLNKRFGRGS